MRRKSGIFSPSPNSKKRLKRAEPAEAKLAAESSGPAGTHEENKDSVVSCKGCQKAMKAVTEMRKTLDALAKLREDADSVHSKSVEETNILAERAREELALSNDRAEALQKEIDALSAALKSTEEEALALKQEVSSKQGEIDALKQSALEAQQQQRQRRRSSLQLQSPAPPSPAKVSASGSGLEESAESIHGFYRELTGMSVVQKNGGYECVLENREKGRTVKFRIAVEDRTAHYTPLTIDVPDRVTASASNGDDDAEIAGCVLTEVVTEPIDFPMSQLPVFLSRLIDELFM